MQPFTVLAAERPCRLLLVAMVAAACAGHALTRDSARLDPVQRGFSSTENFIAEVRMSQATIGSIEVVGNRGISTQELLDLVGQSVVIGAPVADESIERALLAVSALYWDRGYAEVAVQHPVLSDGPTQTLTITVVEGGFFRLGRLSVIGVSPAQAKRYVQHLKIATGDPFNRTAISAAREQLEEIVDGEDTVMPHVTLHRESKTIDLELAISRAIKR